jgi:hypothetical protein
VQKEAAHVCRGESLHSTTAGQRRRSVADIIEELFDRWEVRVVRMHEKQGGDGNDGEVPLEENVPLMKRQECRYPP